MPRRGVRQHASRTRLGQAMFELRKARKLGQQEVAVAMGVHPDKVRRFEYDQLPRPKEISRFCEALHLSEEESKELMRVFWQSGLGEKPSEEAKSYGWGASNVFSDAYAILYSAEAPVSYAYKQQSEMTASVANEHTGHSGGLQGLRVLDLGSGYGQTTLAVMAYCPEQIIAVDRAAGMVNMFEHVLLSQGNIDIWLRSKGADELLEDLYAKTAAHLRWMRATYEKSLFRKRGGQLMVLNEDIMTLDPQTIGLFHCIIANNSLHWPIKERQKEIMQARRDVTDEDALAQAIPEVLKRLASLLRPGGILVAMEPKAFISFDKEEDKDLENELTANTLTENSIYRKFHLTLQHLLKEKYDRDYEIPEKPSGYPMSKLDTLAKEGGFTMKRWWHRDVTFVGDALTTCFTLFPLTLGSIDLPFSVKVELGRQVRREIPAMLTDEDAMTPIREQQFYLVFQRLDDPVVTLQPTTIT